MADRPEQKSTPKVHEPFDLPDIRFPVPFGMDRHLAAILPRTYDVELEWLLEDGAKHKVNGLRLTPPATLDGETEVTADELCQVMLAMANVHAEEDEAEDARTYRVKMCWRDEGNKPHRKFWKFVVTPPGSDVQPAKGRPAQTDPYADHVMDENSTQMEYAQRSFERQQKLAGEANTMILRQVESTMNTILKAHAMAQTEQRLQNEDQRKALRESRAQTDQAQDRLFKMALAMTANNEQQEAMQAKALEMFTMGWQWYMTSATQQIAMLERRHKEELARIREGKKEENRWGWVKDFGPSIMAFGGSLLSHMGVPLGELLKNMGEEEAKAAQSGAQYGGQPDAPPAGFESTEDPPSSPPTTSTPGPSSTPNSSASSPTPTPSWSPPSPPTINEMSMGAKARRFGELFTAAAWAQLRAGMSAETLGILTEFVTADDAKAAPMMMLFTRRLTENPSEDQLLNNVLTAEQIELAGAIVTELQQQAAQRSARHETTQQPTEVKVEVVATKGSRIRSSVDAEDDLEELRALLASVRGLPPSARTELESYGSVAELTKQDDDELLGIPGIGPATLGRLRAKL
jgi:hypothetical protein